MDRGRLSISLLSFYGVETGYVGEIARCQISSIELREIEREKNRGSRCHCRNGDDLMGRGEAL